MNASITYNGENFGNSMTVAEVAEIMNKTPSFVRIGIQRGILPFGVAQIMPKSNKYTYYISPVLFFKYIGRQLPEKYREKQEVIATGKFAVITDPTIARQASWNWRS